MKLIDADELKKVLPSNWDLFMQVIGVIHLINEAKEINPNSLVVNGKWVPCFEDWRKQIEGDKCSICGFEHYGTNIRNYKYCPNCGVKMDLEEENVT